VHCIHLAHDTDQWQAYVKAVTNHRVHKISAISLNVYPSIYPSSTYLSKALEPFVGPWPLFQFLNPIHSWKASLDGGLARRKAATYAQNAVIHTSSGI
jgi:hypothetical protein